MEASLTSGSERTRSRSDTVTTTCPTNELLVALGVGDGEGEGAVDGAGTMCDAAGAGVAGRPVGTDRVDAGVADGAGAPQATRVRLIASATSARQLQRHRERQASGIGHPPRRRSSDDGCAR